MTGFDLQCSVRVLVPCLRGGANSLVKDTTNSKAEASPENRVGEDSQVCGDVIQAVCWAGGQRTWLERRQGKPKGSVLDAHEAFILGALRDKPDTTLDEMVERLAAERGVRVVRTAVWKFLDRRDQTHKKRLPMPVSKSVPT